jgi:hypothetical protein
VWHYNPLVLRPLEPEEWEVRILLPIRHKLTQSSRGFGTCL